MHKRGQVTVFIIIGILMVAVIGLMFVLTNTSRTTQLAGQQKVSANNPLQNFIENCLRRSTIDGLYEVLEKGGYNAFPIDAKIFEFTSGQENLQLPYYFDQGKNEVPAMAEVAAQVADAAEPFFAKCIDNFSQFPQEIEIKNLPIISVQFATGVTKAAVDYPIRIRTDTKETILEKFSTTIPFDFGTKYAAIGSFLSVQEEEPNYFAMGKLSSVAADNNFDAFFNTFNGSNIVVDLVFRELLKDDPLIYSFTLGYDWGDLHSEEELQLAEAPLQLNYISEWNITSPGIQTFTVTAVGEGITFETEPADLPINPTTGVITINTRNFPNDEYLYYVQVRDAENRTVQGPIILNVNVNPGNYPVLEPIPVETVSVGQEFKYTVQPQNQATWPFLFTTDSTQFTINKATGEIKFTPTREDAGPQSMRIDVENRYGRTWVRWEFEVQ